MIRCSDSHIAMEMGQQDALAGVMILSAKGNNPFLLGFDPVYASLAAVQFVCGVADVAKIAKTVIRAVTVDVVDYLRLLAVGKKPCKSVDKIGLIVDSNSQVSIALFIDFATRYFACVGVVLNDIAHRIRNNFDSHAESPLSVVRGLVVGATSTPILPYLPYPAAIAGEPTGYPPVFTIRHPFKERR